MKEYSFQCEVAVVGAGPAGLCAAIAAARMGRDVLLIEKNGYLGGNCVTGLPLLGFLDLDGRRVTGGIAQEFVDRLIERGACAGHRTCPKHNSVTNVTPDEFKVLAIEMCREAGVRILLHSEAIDVEVENGEIKKAIFFGKGNRIVVEAKTFLDCTGDGDIAYLCGCSYEMGQKATGVLQPPTVLFTLQDVDTARLFDYIEAHPEEMTYSSTIEHRPGYDADYFRASDNHVFVGLRATFTRLREAGKCPVERETLIYIKSFHKGEVYVNSTRLLNTDATDILSLTNAELEGQLQVPKLTQMLRENVPGFENCFVSAIYPSLGVRETRRFMGISYLTSDRICAGEIPEDSIALGAYKIDIHSGVDRSTIFKAVKDPYGIPYGCLVSREIGNLLFAGRCVSVDAEVLSSLRVMPQCMSMGEAAGVGAALALRDGIKPSEVCVTEVREILLQNGAILTMEQVKTAPINP